MAKQIIAQWNYINLPALVVHAEYKTNSGKRHSAEETVPGERFEVYSAELEAGLGDCRPDVLLHDLRGRRLAVEICVTHAVDEAKQARVVSLDHAMIEYDLSMLSRDGLDELRLAAELAVMTPHWVHHPLAGSAGRRLEDALRRAAEDEVNVRGAAGLQTADSFPLAPNQAGKQPGVADAKSAEADHRRRSDHYGMAEMVFDPALGLHERGKPPKPPRRLADFTLMGAEVRIRSHDLLDAVTVWVCDSRPELQVPVLHILAKDGRAAGVTCSTHALYLGYFIAWGTEAARWVRDLPGRLVTLECIAPSPPGRSLPACSTPLLERLQILRSTSPSSSDVAWSAVAPSPLGCHPDSSV